MKKIALITTAVLLLFSALSLYAIQCKPPKHEVAGKCYYSKDVKKAKANAKRKRQRAVARRKVADKKACASAEEGDTRNDWKKYLRKFPRGRCATKAGERIKQIEEEEAEEREAERRRIAKQKVEREEEREAEKEAEIEAEREAKRKVARDVEWKNKESLKQKNFPHNWVSLDWSNVASSEMDWDSANEYCENLGGRLPTLAELHKLWDYDVRPGGWFWSSHATSGVLNSKWATHVNCNRVRWLKGDNTVSRTRSSHVRCVK